MSFVVCEEDLEGHRLCPLEKVRRHYWDRRSGGVHGRLLVAGRVVLVRAA